MEEVQIPKARYQIEFLYGNKSIIIKSESSELEFGITREDFNSMIDHGYLPKPEIIEAGRVVYLFNNHEDYSIMIETAVLLLAFKEMREWKIFKKYADVVVSLNLIQLLFWYSRVIEYKNKNKIEKVIKAFEDLYL